MTERRSRQMGGFTPPSRTSNRPQLRVPSSFSRQGLSGKTFQAKPSSVPGGSACNLPRVTTRRIRVIPISERTGPLVKAALSDGNSPGSVPKTHRAQTYRININPGRHAHPKTRRPGDAEAFRGAVDAPCNSGKRCAPKLRLSIDTTDVPGCPGTTRNG